jgi:hypothetical protein
MNSLLEHDHEELGAILRDLFAAIDMSDAEESFRRLDLFWARLGVHIRAEHLCLFPALLLKLNNGRKQRGGGDAPSLDEARQAIAHLRADHSFFMRELASATKQMRDLCATPDDQSAANILQDVRRRVAAIRDRLDAHNKLEEERVYQWVNKLLSPREQTRLAAKLRYEIENLPPRYLATSAVD